MNKWQKSSPESIQAFDRLLARLEGAERRQMFGYPTGYVNGNWFIGCYQGDEMVLRLSERDREQFLTLDQARRFEPMPGRVMRDFVVVPRWLIDDEVQMLGWMSRSMDYSSSLPKSQKKSKKSGR